jgi:hypothetical protein
MRPESGRSWPSNANVTQVSAFRRVSGIAGIVGGVLLVSNALWNAVSGDSRVPFTLVGLGLVGVCEIGLLREFARVHRSSATILAVLLLPTGLLAALGFYSLMTAGSLAGVAWGALGVATWFIAAPLVAVGDARAGLVDTGPAWALGVLTGLAVVASAVVRESLLQSAILGAWALAWVWLGFALLRPSGQRIFRG